MNKKAMSISIVILTIATFVLLITSLYVFSVREDTIMLKIASSKFLEDVYSREEIINFYVEEIVQSIEIDRADKGVFREEFQKNLDRYKVNGEFMVPELSQLESQLKDGNMEIIENGEKMSIEFEITLKNNMGIFNAEHTYKKEFLK